MNSITQWWKALFRDKRSAWEIKREQEFIKAINALKNFTVTDRGSVSIDPEEIRDYVIARRQELSSLIAPKDQESPSMGTADLESETYVELISWRRLNHLSAIRYVCLQAPGGRGFCIASARYFSAEETLSAPCDEERGIAHRLMGTPGERPLEWHPTLSAALEAHEMAF